MLPEKPQKAVGTNKEENMARTNKEDKGPGTNKEEKMARTSKEGEKPLGKNK